MTRRDKCPSGEPVVYVAAPLFNEMETARNISVKRLLMQNGYRVYLPREDSGISYVALDQGGRKDDVRRRIFELDSRAIQSCDIFLCLLDGRVPDEGTCVELGMAFALKKPCIAYKTDHRAMDDLGDNNIMVDGCVGWRMAHSLDELLQMLRSIAR